MPDLNFFRDFNGEDGANSSTARRSHLFPPCNLYTSTESANLCGFPADTGPCQLDTSAPWSLNPTGNTGTAGLVGHSANFPFWRITPQCGEVPGRQGARLASGDAFANGVDALANGVDAVNTAFLLLVQFQGGWQVDGSVDLLTLLLREGHLPQNELLALVDWERLQNVAETSASRVFRTASRLVPRGHSKPDELPCSSILNTTTFPSDFSRLDLSTCSAGFSPQPDTPFYFPEYPLCDVATCSAAQSSTIHTPSSPSSPLLTPPPDFLSLPAVQSEEPGVRPSEHRQSVSQTSHVDSVVPAKRRCHDCGVENTKQWRTRPEIPGSLCNACGQHHSKHRAPRSLQVIMRERAKANNRKHAETLSTSPSPLPEKRGGEVIMRVDPTKPENHN
ncbi:hypothetical protein C8R45DRAFT_1073137 [Mycena sanguinolenta]|nr:hypothetical protein C8R45DRAFT_1073137 [Mycena sanguinolenta]